MIVRLGIASCWLLTAASVSQALEYTPQGLAAPGGATSVHQFDENAFSLPSANMSVMRKLDFSVGNSFFRNPWVAAPASTGARDGLGPLFNTNTCQGCHVKDGRGHAPTGPEDNAVSLLIRLSVPPKTEQEHALIKQSGVIEESEYGGQLQDFAIPSVAAEGRISVTWTETTVALAGGESASLRTPVFTIEDLQYGPLAEDVMLSPRVAPPMIGLGLLEAIKASDILAHEDVQDANQDGISGKANYVWDQQAGRLTLGRFGWKAGQPSLMQQNAGAFNGDLGITSALFTKDHCTSAQQDCLKAPNGNDKGDEGAEVSDKILRFVEFYSQNLAVPVRRQPASPEVVAGEKVFHASGCASCHQPNFVTPEIASQPEQSNQSIWPYTDLLLHDMGPALADNRPEFLADGQEWRTPPLWGIGLTKEVSGVVNLLHDGRARNVLEAILWHGGEAEAAKQKIITLSKEDRAALVAFVESL